MKKRNVLGVGLVSAAAILAGTAQGASASTSPQLTAATNAYRAWVGSEAASCSSGCASSRRHSTPATSPARRRSTARCTHTTSRSSRWRRASAASIPRSTRAPTTFPLEVARLPQDRAAALPEEHDRRHPCAREAARRGRRDPRREGEDAPADTRRACDRLGRAAERDRELEDHRRGGALLAHRPRRLPGEPRRRQGGVRAVDPGAREAAETRRSRRRSAPASPPCRRTGQVQAGNAARVRALRGAELDRPPCALGEVDALAEPMSTVASKLRA